MKESKMGIVKPVSLSDQAYEIIKEQIITNQIKAGELLTEEQLATRLNISRTPVRSALKQLVMERLAEINESKKVVVSKITQQDVKEVCEVRKALEPLALENIDVKNTDKLVKELKKCIKAQSNARTHDVYLEQENLFHMLLAEAGENQFLCEMIERIQTMVKRYLILSGTLDRHSEEALDEHRTIVDFLEQKEMEKASAAMRTHLENVEKRMFIL